MWEIHVIEDERELPAVREIFWEFLQWVNERVEQEYQLSFDIAAILARDMIEISKFMPPSGRIILGTVEQRLVGITCLKSLGDCCGEIKRTYVRPDARRLGLGRALLGRLLSEAAQAGYPRIRLDSTRFMVEAHRLYRSLGFYEIEPYEGSEIPPDYQSNWIFMEKVLGA